MVASFVEMVGKPTSGLEGLKTIQVRTFVFPIITFILRHQDLVGRTLWTIATQEVPVYHISVVILRCLQMILKPPHGLVTLVASVQTAAIYAFTVVVTRVTLPHMLF